LLFILASNLLISSGSGNANSKLEPASISDEMPLLQFLLAFGKSKGYFFTLEEAWLNGEAMN
jgi:hypothetical protein